MKPSACGPRELIPDEEVYAEWENDPTYCETYIALADEFAMMSALIRAQAAVWYAEFGALALDATPLTLLPPLAG